MPASSRRPLLVLLVLAAGPVLGGCHAAPRLLDEMLSAGSEADGPADGGDAYWAVRGTPPETGGDRDRVAVVEFCVEYVTDKSKTPFSRQPMARADGFTPLGQILHIGGVGRQKCALREPLMEDLSEELYLRFEEMLAEEGLTVVPRERVAAAPAYAWIRDGAADGDTSPMFTHADTGRINNLQVFPARHLVAVDEDAFVGESDLRAIEAQLLDEIDADLALRVTFRVGLEQGHPSIESGSEISATWRPHFAGHHAKLVSTHSLLSPEPAVREASFQLFQGDVFTVHDDTFRQGVLDVFEAYAGLAIDALP